MRKEHSSIGDRMKEYEYVSRNFLTRHIPVVIRVDGKAFHTFTKGMTKPFDSILMTAMQETMKYMCENIQGCVLGYTQSDEITLVLTDYDTIATDAWFGYNIQKMSSISASMATLAFNKAFRRIVQDQLTGTAGEDDETFQRLRTYALEKSDKAMFDARVFTVPKDEVCNCLIWRQQDATRNSIESVGQAYFSTKKLFKKNCNEIQDMLFTEHAINWNDYPTDCKRGACCHREIVETVMPHPKTGEMITVSRKRWKIDRDIPIFTQDREYITKWL